VALLHQAADDARGVRKASVILFDAKQPDFMAGVAQVRGYGRPSSGTVSISTE
jgi:hypothetical protein